MKNLYLLIGLIFFYNHLFSQDNNNHIHEDPSTIIRCGSDDYHKELMDFTEGYAEWFHNNQKLIRSKVDPNKSVVCGSPIIIPVAVHYHGAVTAANTSCLILKAQEQIDVLNEDFGGYNLDITNYCDYSDDCPSDYPPDVITQGTCIQFCLASMNHPSCEPAANLIGGYAITVGQHSWPFASCWSGYINFFVADLPGGLLGQAPLFGGANPNGNGTRVTASSWGGGVNHTGPCTSGIGIDDSSIYNLGRTATHEAGHYYGLEHTFAGCNNGDGIADTPSQSTPNNGCPTFNTASCTSTANNSCGEPDFWFNFMDYVNDACMWMFTEDQSQLMYNTALMGNYNSSAASCAASDLPVYNPTYPTGCGATVIPLAANILSTIDVICNGDNTGSITVNVTGGTMPYFFAINGVNVGSNPTISPLFAGAYTLTVSDSGTQSISFPFTISEPPPINITINDQTNVECNDDSDGSVDASALGGTPVLQYSIDGINYQFEGIFSGLGADNYTLTVKDQNGCLETEPFEITEPDVLEFDAAMIVDLECYNDSSGVITVLAQGGTPSYTYTNIQNSESNSDGMFSNLPQGSYNIEVTDDNGCTYEENFTTLQPDSLELEVASSISASCGDDNGQISFNAQGGTGSYMYSIDNTSYQTSPIFEDLSGGPLNGFVQDDNGCITMISTMVPEDSSVSLTIGDQNNAQCLGDFSGSVDVNTTGGTGSITYELGSMTNNDGVFTNLTVGAYLILATDENNCSSEIEVEIEAVSTLAIQIEEVNNILCAGSMDGLIEVNATGGASDYQYSIDGGNTFIMTPIFVNLDTGNYEIIVQDGSGCQSLITESITAPNVLALDISNVDHLECNGAENGIVNVEAQGGTGSLTYELDNVSNGSGIFENLTAGDYMVFVTDENNCQTTLPVTITQPDAITFNVFDKVDSNCEGDPIGAFSISAEGGVGVFDYAIVNQTNQTGVFTNLSAGGYEVTITDENDCEIIASTTVSSGTNIIPTIESFDNPSCSGDADGVISVSSEGGTGIITFTLGTMTNMTGVFNNIPSGVYEVELMDEADCFTSIEVTLTDPDMIEASLVNSTDASCADTEDATISISATGGTPSYTFTLNNESNTTGVFENLGAGNFEVTIQDNNDCITTLPVEVNAPSNIEVTGLNVIGETCFGESDGSLTIELSGGQPGYEYEINGVTSQNGVFENLTGTSWTINYSDANNCKGQIDYEANLPVLTPVSGNTEELIDVSCFEGNNGIVDIEGLGGVGAYSYSLGSDQNSDGVFQNLESNVYTAVITDNNGCSAEHSFTISSPTQITGQVIDVLSDKGTGDGSVNLSASGGTPPYAYQLENGSSQTDPVFENLSAGSYTVTIIDARDCEVELRFEIEEQIFADTKDIQIKNQGPNPTTNSQYTMIIDSYGAQEIRAAIFDARSQLVGNRIIQATSGENTIAFDYSDLPQGVYLAVLYGEKVNRSARVVKMD